MASKQNLFELLDVRVSRVMEAHRDLCDDPERDTRYVVE